MINILDIAIIEPQPVYLNSYIVDSSLDYLILSRLSLLIMEFVVGGLSFYYELDLLEDWELACGSLEMEEA